MFKLAELEFTQLGQKLIDDIQNATKGKITRFKKDPLNSLLDQVVQADRFTFVKYAAQHMNCEGLRYLIGHWDFEDQIKTDPQDLLFHALCHDARYTNFKYLIEQFNPVETKINCQSGNIVNANILHVAIALDKSEMIQYLMEKKPSLVAACNGQNIFIFTQKNSSRINNENLKRWTLEATQSNHPLKMQFTELQRMLERAKNSQPNEVRPNALPSAPQVTQLAQTSQLTLLKIKALNSQNASSEVRSPAIKALPPYPEKQISPPKDTGQLSPGLLSPRATQPVVLDQPQTVDQTENLILNNPRLLKLDTIRETALFYLGTQSHLDKSTFSQLQAILDTYEKKVALVTEENKKLTKEIKKLKMQENDKKEIISLLDDTLETRPLIFSQKNEESTAKTLGKRTVREKSTENPAKKLSS